MLNRRNFMKALSAGAAAIGLKDMWLPRPQIESPEPPLLDNQTILRFDAEEPLLAKYVGFSGFGRDCHLYFRDVVGPTAVLAPIMNRLADLTHPLRYDSMAMMLPRGVSHRYEHPLMVECGVSAIAQHMMVVTDMTIRVIVPNAVQYYEAVHENIGTGKRTPCWVVLRDVK